MVIMILEKVPASLRGELTRWLIEAKTGVYIGHVNGMVRDKLWELCLKSRGSGAVFQAWSTNTEQHLKMRMHGQPDRSIVEWEGLQLIQEVQNDLSVPQKRRIKRET